jgi:Zn-dependent peptidase ImmA (M78 family)/DNA-binding XRE family transcriptional regulator
VLACRGRVRVLSETALQVGERVQAARKDAGLSQAEVAEVLGLSQAAVSHLEAGRRSPRVDELAALAELVGRDLDYFLVPMRKQEVLGMTFRAVATAELPLPELQRALIRFIDDIESRPVPEPGITIRATQPERAASETRKKAALDAVPVDVKAVARKLGVAMFFRPLPDALSAFLLRGEGRSIIGVNANQPLVRQRFSAAHECGHFVLGHTDESVFDYAVPATSDGEPPGYDWKNEREANTYAAELLMPRVHLQQDAVTTSLSRLARRYEVSQEAMSFRLQNLGLRAV